MVACLLAHCCLGFLESVTMALLHQQQVVPEFSFLDARGVGELERLPLGEAAAALEAGDSLAPTWRPNPNVDGTVVSSQ